MTKLQFIVMINKSTSTIIYDNPQEYNKTGYLSLSLSVLGKLKLKIFSFYLIILQFIFEILLFFLYEIEFIPL